MEENVDDKHKPTALPARLHSTPVINDRFERTQQNTSPDLSPYAVPQSPIRSTPPSTPAALDTKEAVNWSTPQVLTPRKGKASRVGVPNYSKEDISVLMDHLDEVEPFGSSQWAIVAYKFREWAATNSRPQRDQESLRNKFDKLANAKKKTGEPSCPCLVRRAKHIDRKHST